MQSHEDKYSSGIPDLSYGANGVNGWIELKQAAQWPNKPAGVVKLKFTPIQVNWLLRRGKKGGRCFVMVKIGDDLTIFNSENARAIRAGADRSWYYANAIAIWHKSLDPDRLLEILTC